MNRSITNNLTEKQEFSATDKRKRQKLQRELGALYPLLLDEDVEEILVNPNGKVWVDRAGSPRFFLGHMSETERMTLLSTVASSLNTFIDERKPYLDGPLILDGSRISGDIPPIVDAPALRIRKHARTVQSLEWLVEQGTLTVQQLDIIRDCIQCRLNMVIVGSTASGKTFLAKSILQEIALLAPTDRILTIEDTPELVVKSQDALRWITSPDVTMQLMLQRALRATPDRIVVGEVRGGEAYQLLKMWNTGHSGGLCTLHSDKGHVDGLIRLERMCGESSETRGMGALWIRELVASVVHVLIKISNDNGQRRVTNLVRVHGLTGDTTRPPNEKPASTDDQESAPSLVGNSGVGSNRLSSNTAGSSAGYAYDVLA